MSDLIGAGGRAPRQQLSDVVESYVRELILTGQAEPGSYLRLEPIAEALGVSNTPVREGLLALRSEGFLRLVPRRGFLVMPFTAHDVRDLFWAQAELAGELAFRAAKGITPAELNALQAVVDENEAAVARGDADAVARLGHQFHRIINLAADSHRLAMLVGAVVGHLPSTFYATIDGQVDASLDEHPAIVAALRDGNAREARALMTRHIQAVSLRLTTQIKARRAEVRRSTSALT